MPAHAPRRSPAPRRAAAFALLLVALAITHPAPAGPPAPLPPGGTIRPGDRVAWVGSSSTRIGVWTRTVEFLLRTRHPGQDLQFRSFTTGGGTFATGLEHLDEWLDDYKPTLVVFNFGGNDATAGRQGFPRFLGGMEQCVTRAQAKGARVILVTPQAADARKSGPEAAARRTLYAETMLAIGRSRGWPVIDVHHPLDALQRAGEAADPAYTILKDKIHLTDPAYVGWGYLFYDRLDLPLARSEAVLTATGEVKATENCEVRDVEAAEGTLAFTRHDQVLPILPLGPLPPRGPVPLEAQSRYLLAITGLPPGDYEIRAEGRPIGVVDARALADGVNLNTLLLNQGQEAPWADLVRSIWEGKNLDQIGKTAWRFEIHRR